MLNAFSAYALSMETNDFMLKCKVMHPALSFVQNENRMANFVLSYPPPPKKKNMVAIFVVLGNNNYDIRITNLVPLLFFLEGGAGGGE